MSRAPIHLGLLAILVSCVFALQNSHAAPPVDSATFTAVVKPFFAKHCNDCHGADEAEGDLRLDTLDANFTDRKPAGHWVEVLDRVNLGEMPPEDEPRPNPADLAKVTDWISQNLLQMQRQAESTDGRVLMRRLSRTEYANTVRDLLGVEFVDGEGPLEDLPPDGRIQGFDRMSKALLVDPSLMDSYIQVGQQVAERAIVFRPPAVPTRTMHFDFVDTADSAMSYILDRRNSYLQDNLLVIMQDNARTFGKLKHPSINKEIPVTGRYRIRVKAAADPGSSDNPVYMDITYGSLGRLKRFRVDAAPETPQVYEFEQTFDASVPGEFGVRIVDGTSFQSARQVVHEKNRHQSKLFDAGNHKESLKARARMRAEGDFTDYIRSAYLQNVVDLKPLPKLMLEWIEVTGPIQPDFPPPSMKRIFPTGIPSAEEQKLESAKAAYKRLLPRAFRRKTTDQELASLVRLFQSDLDAGSSFEQAMETGITAMLCSPNFLFLREDESTGERKLTGFELATRLSYLLWSSKPDDDLYRSAMKGNLTKDPRELDRQIDRMLADPRSEGFVDGFARQWLKVDEFTRFPPDMRIFPKFYETEFAGLANDVKNEPLEFFREVLHKDESIRSFLSSGWLMLNERLASYYGIEGVQGEHFRRVPLIKPDGWIQHARERLKNKPRIGPLHFVGPFSADDADAAFKQAFPPEEKVDLDQAAGALEWQVKSDWADGQVHEVLNDQNSAYYIYRQIDSAINQKLTLALGSDDAIKVWANGREVLSNFVMRAVEPKQERVTIDLKKGRNDVLVKIVNGGGEGAFYFLAETIPDSVITAIDTPGKQRNQAQRQVLEDIYLSESTSAPRGGLLGMAGVHLWGADGNRTKPVERGKYLLTVLFNDPPPPPPPNAGEVEPNLRGKQLTVRERLELHREQATCNNCHRRIDPYGLAMENFNAIGQWRKQTDGEKPVNQYWGERPLIDPSGILPNGKPFRNFLEFKRAILAQETRFARGLTEKLMMYALGRTIEPQDRPVIDRILAESQKEGMTLRAILKHIARSEPFRTK